VSTTEATAGAGFDLKVLAVELQSLGVRTRETLEGRSGGAGPSDAGFIWIDGAPLTVPVHGDYAARSPYELVMHSSGRAGRLLRDGVEIGPVHLHPRPKIYDLQTADGIPYWKIALMHLDSMASTVFQRCVYWGTDDQCHFCAIGTSLKEGRTIPLKTPALLAEVAEAAARLDGAKDVTLTTGTPNRDDRGASYMARCAAAIRESSGLPIQVQLEPPNDFAWFRELKDSGACTWRCGTGRCWRASPRASTPRAVSSTSRPGRRRSPSSGGVRCRRTSSSASASRPSR
jgi:radical SAM protein (TIGR04043 family)